MRPYHRLDLSLHTPRREGRAKLTFSIYNLYNRRNPLYLFVTSTASFDGQAGFNDRTTRVRQISLFPILPSISYSFSF